MSLASVLAPWPADGGALVGPTTPLREGLEFIGAFEKGKKSLQGMDVVVYIPFHLRWVVGWFLTPCLKKNKSSVPEFSYKAFTNRLNPVHSPMFMQEQRLREARFLAPVTYLSIK